MQLYAKPEKQAETTPTKTKYYEIWPETSKPFNRQTPINAREKKSHCFFLTRSLNITTANSAVKTGDKYCIVTAPAKGMFWRVIKNKQRPIVPNKPLAKSTFLLLPKIGILFLFKYNKVINNDPSDLKKTSSKTGICGIALTHKCIKEKANEEIIICCAPLFIVFVLHKDKLLYCKLLFALL